MIRTPFTCLASLAVFICLFHLTPQSNANGDSKPGLWDSYGMLLEKTLKPLRYTSLDGEFYHAGVDYHALNTNKENQALVAAQRESLKSVTPATARNEALVFWMNAYNFFTLDEVDQNYKKLTKGDVMKGMKSVGWKNRIHNAGGTLYTLDQIEHKIIRAYDEPRIHFAINCASVGCPTLAPTPFTITTLDQQLNALMDNAMKNPIHIRVVETGLFSKSKKIGTTQLFDWFGKDFKVSPYKSILGFIHHYAPKRYKAFSDHTDAISYDWNANDVKNIEAHFKTLASDRPDLKIKKVN